MKEILIPIDKVGRIVLPKNLREELSIKPGDMFKVSISGSSVTLIPDRESSGFVRKGNALVFCTTGDSTLSNKTVGDTIDAGRGEQSEALKDGLTKKKRLRQ